MNLDALAQLEKQVDDLEEVVSSLEVNMTHIAKALVAIVTIAKGDSTSDGSDGLRTALSGLSGPSAVVHESGPLSVELDEETFDGLDGFTRLYPVMSDEEFIASLEEDEVDPAEPIILDDLANHPGLDAESIEWMNAPLGPYPNDSDPED